MIDPVTGLPDPDFVNTVTGLYQELRFDVLPDTRVQGIPLFRSPDGRVVVTVTRYPDGATFAKGGSADYHESFYVIAGDGTRALPDGRTFPMVTGDLIHVPPRVEIAYRYEPGFADIAFFWSATTLPGHLAGPAPRMAG